MTSEGSPVWFITGCSTGFGRELAKLVLARGWRAVVTARDQASVADLVRGAGDRALTLDLDLANAAQIAAAVPAAEARFGHIDVLVNNAGYSYHASVEEGVDAEIRAMFEANMFGLFALTRTVLPGMRARRKGHIINITSVAGHRALHASGYYAATKHAVEGFSDALLAEVGPLGIKVTCVAPGPFRTDWASRSLHKTTSVIADYADTVLVRQQALSTRVGEPGDPVRAGEAIIRITEVDNPPRHLLLGVFCINTVIATLKARLAEIEAWREVGLATDFPTD